MSPDRAHGAFARRLRESDVATYGHDETRGMAMLLAWAIAVTHSV